MPNLTRDQVLAIVAIARTNATPPDLSAAQLQGCNLMDVDLRGAILRNANMRVARLSRANLADADLQGANLQGESQGANSRGRISGRSTSAGLIYAPPTWRERSWTARMSPPRSADGTARTPRSFARPYGSLIGSETTKVLPCQPRSAPRCGHHALPQSADCVGLRRQRVSTIRHALRRPPSPPERSPVTGFVVLPHPVHVITFRRTRTG